MVIFHSYVKLPEGTGPEAVGDGPGIIPSCPGYVFDGGWEPMQRQWKLLTCGGCP